MASLEDPSGARCVDILRYRDGGWSWVECRRDPEDSHGWRRLTTDLPGPFADRDAAFAAACQAVGWLKEA